MTDRDELDLIRESLRRLGKRKLMLSIHDGSFPGDSDEDLGRGTPYSRGGGRFVQFVRDLGFAGLQLGPQGQTSRGNPSPYDGTAFSRNSLSIAVRPLVDGDGLLREEELTEEIRLLSSGLSSSGGERVRYREAYDAHRRLLLRAFQRFGEIAANNRGTDPPSRAVARELAEFSRRNRAWLEPDSLYEALSELHGSEDWRRWPDRPTGELDRRLYRPRPGEEERCSRRRRELLKAHGRQTGFYRFCQFLAHRQHLELQAAARSLGLELFADLQIGLSSRDVWSLGSLFLPGYALGAPPSRTNPSGQPWGYPIFTPDGYTRGGGNAAGPVAEVLRRRVDKLFGEYDGLRIDHPQGLVCPWVYRTDDPDALRAVQNGARLFESPDLPDHPRLAAYAIVRPEQLASDPSVNRYADRWVRELEAGQVERYAALMGVLVESARNHGRGIRNIACEVLSTLPYPLERVLRLYHLGRFRVTQKAELHNPQDVYRSENAEESDWIMLGTHDSAPIWKVAEGWFQSGEAPQRADYLAQRLAAESSRSAFRTELLRRPGRLVHAQMADALASRAEQVLVFFADLFGLREVYNTPGSVDPLNWSLRVPADYRSSYRESAARLEALNLPYALALALGSPGRQASVHAGLIERLWKLSGTR